MKVNPIILVILLLGSLQACILHGGQYICSDTVTIQSVSDGQTTTINCGQSLEQFGYSILGFEVPPSSAYKIISNYSYSGTSATLTWSLLSTTNKIKIHWISASGSLAQLRPFEFTNVPHNTVVAKSTSSSIK